MSWKKSVFDILPRSRALRHDFQFFTWGATPVYDDLLMQFTSYTKPTTSFHNMSFTVWFYYCRFLNFMINS